MVHTIDHEHAPTHPAEQTSVWTVGTDDGPGEEQLYLRPDKLLLRCLPLALSILTLPANTKAQTQQHFLTAL
jgi:hypothetical protein